MTASTGNVPGRIFMSYRRDDTSYPAAWLYDRLASHFGREHIFKDVDSIEPGDDFAEVINAAVGSCDVLLALIGGRWLTLTGNDGRPRLDNPRDFVRLEVEAALARNVRVIPILIDGARMPRADELPPSLAKLARRQAVELSPNRFETDTRRLLRVLNRTVAEAQEQARHEAERATRHQRQVEQQAQLRERAAAQDWEAVVAASDERTALNPAAADSEGPARTARERITRRQQANPAPARAQQSADDQLNKLGESAQETTDAQGLPPSGQTGAKPVVGSGPPPGGVDHQPASIAGDDHPPPVTDVPRAGPGEEPAPAIGLRIAGPAVSHRLGVIAATVGIAVIGVVTAIITTSTNSTSTPTPTITFTPSSRTQGSVSGPSSSRSWAYTTGGIVYPTPAVAGGTVYVGSDDHKVYALDAATGHLRWRYPTGDTIDSNPAVAGGTIYIGSGDFTVYALKASGSSLRVSAIDDRYSVTPYT